MMLDFVNGTGQLQANPSSVTPFGPTFSARPFNGESSFIFGETTVSLSSLAGGGLGIDLSATNGAPGGQLLGVIDARFEVFPGSDGNVTGTAFLEPFPSFELTQFGNGFSQPILQTSQQSFSGIDAHVGLNSPQQAFPIGGANGGFVLYPSRPNLNSVRPYRK